MPKSNLRKQEVLRIWLMVGFLKNIGFLMIIAGVVLLFSYTMQNRIRNIHYAIACFFEVGGLVVYILTNRFLKDRG